MRGASDFSRGGSEKFGGGDEGGGGGEVKHTKKKNKPKMLRNGQHALKS